MLRDALSRWWDVRPNALNKDKHDLAVKVYHYNEVPIAKISAMLGISKPTLYSNVRAAEGKSAAA